MAHNSMPNGQFHTGKPYPNSTDSTTSSPDCLYVEFMATQNPSEGNYLSMANLQTIGIIVYE